MQLVLVFVLLVGSLAVPTPARAEDIYWGDPGSPCSAWQQAIDGLPGATFSRDQYLGDWYAYGVPVFSFTINYGNSYGYGVCFN